MKIKKLAQRFIPFLMVLAMSFNLGINTFAAEVPNDAIPLSQQSSEVMPRSSISGYAQKTITSSDAYIEVPTTSSGVGGMGITIKTSSSSSGTMNFNGSPLYNIVTSTISGSIALNNGQYEAHNLVHDDSVGTYYIWFSNIPAGASVKVQVWIYG